MAFQTLAAFKGDRHPQREVNRKPAEHTLGVSVRVDGHAQAFIQVALKVSRETMDDSIHLSCEGDLHVAVIVL